MVVIEPRRQGRRGMGWIHPMSRTMAVNGAAQTVRARIAETGDRLQITPRGMGAGEGFSFDSVPTWAWVAGGGLLLGLVGGAIYMKRKRRRR